MGEPEAAAAHAVCCPQCGRDDGLVPYADQVAQRPPEQHRPGWRRIFGGARERAAEPLLPRYYCEHCQTIVDPRTGQTLVRI